MQKFKNMKSWRKGGIIGVCLYIIINLIPLFLPSISLNKSAFSFISFINALPNLLLSYAGIRYYYPPFFWIAFPVMLLSRFAFYFLVGAIIGLVCGKINLKKLGNK